MQIKVELVRFDCLFCHSFEFLFSDAILDATS